MEQHLQKGTTLQGSASRYTIVRTLGQGTFGITYLANAQMAGDLGSLDVKVAIKEFFMKEVNSRSGNIVVGGNTRDGLFEKYRQKFRHEAQHLASMHHPGVVKIIESFDANDTSYIVMEYLSGGSLDNLIVSRGGLPEAQALHFTRSIGNALVYMHSCHMLHLDLKPSNVMLDEQGETVLIDFGLSKQYGDDGAPESSTSVGSGTPGYAPIEQSSYHEGKGFPTAIDVYALGATLFKMLTGHRPPEAADILNDGIPLSNLQGVSHRTVKVVSTAMAPLKVNRYQTVRQMLDALSTLEDTTFEDPGPKPPPDDGSDRGNNKSKAKPLLWVLGILLFLAIASGGIFLAIRGEGNSDIKDTTSPENPNHEIQNVNLLLPVGDCTYSGQYYEDPVGLLVPDGKGKATFPNGDTYEGEFKDGDFVNGTYRWANGHSFTGTFENNTPTSNGTYQ